MSPEQKAYFANPENNHGPDPDERGWTPELLVKLEQAFRERNYSESDVEAFMKHYRGLAEKQRLEGERE